MRYIIYALLLLVALPLQSQKEITVEDIWKNGTFRTKSVPGFRFMNDGQHYTRLEQNTIKKYDLKTGEFVSDVLSGNNIKDQAGFTGNIDNYAFSADESKIMIKSESESIYRRSSVEFVHIYDFESASLIAVYEEDKIMNAQLSPDASKVAYVWKNNLYYFDLASGTTYPVTFDGKKNEIINGATDWVYEEEFAFTRAFEWSPQGTSLGYIRFDESAVPEFTMTTHNDGVYPIYTTFKYPKVGQVNAVVSAHIYNLKTDKSVGVEMGDDFEYIPRIKWTQEDDKLCVFKMNRHQNKLDLLIADAKTGATSLLLSETSKYYIDITDDLTFLKDRKHFVWTSEKSGYNHLYLYDMSGQMKHQLTQGEYDVTSFYGVDENSGHVYYQAAKTSALEKQIYVVGLRGKKKKSVANKPGTNRAQFSSTFDYYVLNNSTINSPSSYTVFNRKGDKIRTIEDNSAAAKRQSEYGVQDVEFFDFITSEDVQLNGWMIKPPNFDETKSYPVFMYLYGGPGSQQVVNGWRGTNYWWFQMLAQKGYIVACVDNRGTGARGEEFKKSTYLKLGELETKDQIEAAKYLGSLPYTDASRIGIFGWSYGGYMSSLCLFKGNDVFKAAIAVAPVTNWKWYDTIYTERYMRTEEENKDGYRENSPVYFADMLKGNYLLVHGDADDNVHFQNTVELSAALIKANKQFDTYFYPNRNHGIYGNNARLHLYTKMTNFLLEKL